jgi:hypothetical protein
MTSAPIRYNNPGAMWGRLGKRTSSDKEVATNNPIASRWGSQRTVYLSDGLGQGNNIAIFPTNVQGAAAQFDLWRTSKHYKNKTVSDAIQTWSGGNSWRQYVDFLISRVPGLTYYTVIDDKFLASPMGILFMKAQAWHESGTPFPMSDAEWLQAQNLVFFGKGVSKKTAGVVAATVGTVVATAGTKAVDSNTAAYVTLGAVIAVALIIGWLLYSHFKHANVQAREG